MDAATFLTEMIKPGVTLLSALTNGRPSVSDNANRMLLAIAQQESGPNLNARYQNSPSASPGPARGWWQFEQGGGVTGVINHSATKSMVVQVTNALTIVNQPAAVWRALEGHDLLACCFARLLLWTDPGALPTTQQAGWNCYLNLWRPGKPKPDAWPGNWANADATIKLSSGGA